MVCSPGEPTMRSSKVATPSMSVTAVRVDPGANGPVVSVARMDFPARGSAAAFSADIWGGVAPPIGWPATVVTGSWTGTIEATVTSGPAVISNSAELTGVSVSTVNVNWYPVSG